MYLERKRREIMVVEQNWQKFYSIDTTDKLKWLDRVKVTVNSSHGQPIGGAFSTEDVLKQVYFSVL
jgi:hypothetical protein